MTRSAPVHHLHQIEGFLCCRAHLPGAYEEQVGSHHATVEPMNHASPLDAAYHADIGPVDLRNDVADEELRQSVGVWQCLLPLLNDSHSTLPGYGNIAALGKSCSVASRLHSYENDTRYSYGVCSSFYLNACSQTGQFARFGCDHARRDEQVFQ
jgi:hypothetical protein